MRGFKKVLSKVWLSLTALALVLSFVPAVLFSGAGSALATTPSSITDSVTFVSSTGATLNGTNGDYDASNTSFWWGTTPAGPFTPGTDPGNSSEFPAGWIHDNGLGAKSAGDPFSGVLTGLTSGTTYYFAAWSEVGDTWYSGAVLNFTTDPAPASILILTVPAAKTITRSVLVPETSGTPSGGSTVVDAAINGLTAIPVTLENTGDAASANVRISPINAGTHIQLWAKDTSGNWFDINVTGWIDSTGKSIPANSSPITTNVYAISDTTGNYPLTVNLVYVAGGTAATAAGIVTVTPIIYTQADFAAFDGVDIGTNSYTVSSGITATYTGSNTIKLTGYAPIVIPWFWPTLTTWNYVTVGIKLPTGFTGTRVYDSGIMRYDVDPAGAYKMSSAGTGSTDLATAGAALGYLDYSFAANSTNTKKDGLVKLQVIWNVGDAPEYFTIDVTDLQLGPDTILPTATVSHNEVAKTITYTFNEPVQLRDADGNVLNSSTYASSLAVYDSVAYLAHIPGAAEPDHAVIVSSAVLSSDAKSIVIIYTGSLIKNADTSYVVDAWGKNITDLAGNKMAKSGSQIFMVTGDTTAPDVPTLVSPANGVFVKPAGLILDWSDVTDSEGSNPVTYVYRSSYSSVVGADNMLTSKLYERDNISESKINASGSSDNTYYWQVRACDSLSNCSDWSGPWKVTIDNTLPAKPTFSSPANNTFTNVNAITLNWTGGDDSGSGVKGYTLRYTFYPANGGSSIDWSTGFVAGTQKTLSGSFGHGEGCYVLYVKTTDNAGNESSESDPLTVTYDKTAPAVPGNPSPANQSYVNTHDFTFSWDAVSDSSPVSYEWEFSYLDTTNQDGSFVSQSGNHTNLSTSVYSPGTPDNIYYWHVRAKDALGNESAWSTPWKVTVDNTAPTANLVFANIGPGATSFDVEFSEPVNPTDATNPANYFLHNWPGAGGTGDLSGNANVKYDGATNTATVTFLNNGWFVSPEQNWGVQGIHDLAGNLLFPNPTSETSTPMVAPTTTAILDGTVDLNGTYVSDVTVDFNATDTAGSGVKATYYNLDGSGYSQGNSVLVTTDGTHNICYYSTDNAGNPEAEKCDVTFNIDQTASVITVNPYTTGPTNQNVVVTASPALRIFGGATFVAGAIAPTPTPSVTPTTTPTTIVDSNQTSDGITKVEGVSDTGSNLWWIWVLAALAVGGGLWWILAKRRVGEDE